MYRVTDRRGSLAIRVLLIPLLAFGPPLPAAVIVADGDACPLASAIAAANSDAAQGGCAAGSGADLILLTSDVTLTAIDNPTDGGNGLPSITSQVTIRGEGETRRAIVRDPAAPSFRLLHVDTGAALALENLSLRNGSVGGHRGGAILSTGTLAITGSTLTGNSALFGGAISSSSDGALASTTLVDSTLADNSAGSVGGGIMVDSGYDGSIALTISGSTLADNSATGGGAIWASTYSEAQLTLTNSTLSGNSAGSRGGAIYTLSYGDLDVKLIHSTLAGNSAVGSGGALYNRYGEVRLQASVIGHSASGGNCDGSPPITGHLDSLADDATCGTIPATLSGLDPTPAGNGGPTRTHALLAGSSAIDQAGTCGLAVDQRGFVRDAHCDAGAYEHGAAAPPEPVGGSLTGARGSRARCLNLTTGQSVEILLGGAVTWDCEAAGLIVAPGDRVRETVTGEVD